MRVIERILFQFILIYALQGFSCVLGIYALCKKEIQKKKYVSASLIISVIFCVMRILPIGFGIHTIFNAIFIFIIAILYLRLPPLPTIRALLIVLSAMLLAEFADIFILTIIFGKEKFDILMNDNLYMYILGIPPSIIFAFFTFITYYLLVSKKTKKSVTNGKIST